MWFLWKNTVVFTQSAKKPIIFEVNLMKEIVAILVSLTSEKHLSPHNTTLQDGKIWLQMTDIQAHGKLYVRPLTIRNPRWNEIYYEADCNWCSTRFKFGVPLVFLIINHLPSTCKNSKVNFFADDTLVCNMNKQAGNGRPKSAPHLMLENNKRTSKYKVFSSTVPV